jgi:ABC-2 type transport system permease protein
MAALGRDDYNETQAKTIKQALGNDDWKAVYKVVIEYNSSIEWKTKEEKELDNWFYSYCIENDIRPERSGKDWKFNLVERLADEKKQAARLESNRQKDEPKSHEQESLENKIAVSQYRLDKNISKNVADLSGGIFAVFNASESIDMWAIMYALLDLVSYLGVFFVIIAGGMVSSEFTGGTIKFLLINPVKRWKILASKYFVTIVTGYLFLILAFTIASMCVGIFSGFANADALYIVAENGKVSAMPALIKVIQLTLLQSVSVVVMATLAFAISSMVRSSALAIGVSLFALVSGSIINTILMVLEADWGRFLIFSNTDLVSIANGLAPYDGQTLPFAIGVIAVHMVIFLLMAWDGFTKREV